MKKILFITANFSSHVKPIIPILNALTKKYQVICVGGNEYKEIIIETGAEFISYPEHFFAKEYCEEKDLLLKSLEEDLQKYK